MSTLAPSIARSLVARPPQRCELFVVNRFLGWTLLGWVIAMAWLVSVVRSDK
jgi:hypothetical protein